MFLHARFLPRAAPRGTIGPMDSSTLRDIARAAAVSMSTASRALNGHPAISRQTASRVREAADTLRYKPRQVHARLDARRCLQRARVGVLSLGLDRSLTALPVIAAALGTVEAALGEAGAVPHLGHVPNPHDVPPALARQRWDGVILVGPMQGEIFAGPPTEWLERLRQLPTVCLLGRPRGGWGDAVGSDDHATGAAAAAHLVAQGHRHLAFVNPKPDHLLFARREDGFVAAARRLGADVQSFCDPPPQAWHLPLQAPQGVETVQTLVDRLMAARPRPTAIFAAADSVAVLVYRALSVRNLMPGRDISVISGNNDATLIAGLHPRLTTFDVHPQDMGRTAVAQLALRISHPLAGPPSETLLQTTPVEGESVATLPRARTRTGGRRR